MDVVNPARPLVLGSSPPTTTPSPAIFDQGHNGFAGTANRNINPNSISPTSSVVDEHERESQNQRRKLELLERQKQHHLRQFLYYRQLAEQEEKQRENQQQQLFLSQSIGLQHEVDHAYQDHDQQQQQQGLGKTSAWIASLAQAEQQRQQPQVQAVDPSSAYIYHSPGSQIDLSGSNSDEVVEDTIADLIAYEEDSSSPIHATNGTTTPPTAAGFVDSQLVDASIVELLQSNSTSRSSISSSSGTVIHTPSPPASVSAGHAGLEATNTSTNKVVDSDWDAAAFGVNLNLDLEPAFELSACGSFNQGSTLVENNVNVFRSTAGLKKDWTDITSYASMYEDQDRAGLQHVQHHQQQQQPNGMLVQKRQMMGQDQMYQPQIQQQQQSQQMAAYAARPMGGMGTGMQVQYGGNGYEHTYRSNVNAINPGHQMMVSAQFDQGQGHGQGFPPPHQQGRMVMMDASSRFGMYAGDGQYSNAVGNGNSSQQVPTTMSSNGTGPGGMDIYAGMSGMNPNQMQPQGVSGRTAGSASFHYDSGPYDSFQPTFNGRVLPAYASMGAVVQASPTHAHMQPQQPLQQQPSQQRQEQGRSSIGLNSPESRLNQSPLSDYHRNMATQNADNINHLLTSGGAMTGSGDESTVKKERASPKLNNESSTDELDQIAEDYLDDDDDERSVGSLVDELDAEVEAALGGASSSRRPSQLRKPSTAAAKAKSHRKTPYNRKADRVEAGKRRTKSISATASSSSRGSGAEGSTNGSEIVLSDRAVISRNILYEDGKPKIRNPLGGGRGYVPGETPDDPSKKHKCEVCGRGFARLFNLKVSPRPV